FLNDLVSFWILNHNMRDRLSGSLQSLQLLAGGKGVELLPRDPEQSPDSHSCDSVPDRPPAAKKLCGCIRQAAKTPFRDHEIADIFHMRLRPVMLQDRLAQHPSPKRGSVKQNMGGSFYLLQILESRFKPRAELIAGRKTAA